MTEWRDIPGFDGAYQVSADGQVRSIAREVLRSGPHHQAHIKTVPGRILKPIGPMKNRVNLYRDRQMECIKIEMLVSWAFGADT